MLVFAIVHVSVVVYDCLRMSMYVCVCVCILYVRLSVRR